MGMNVPVADEFARLIERKVESGRYGSAQDVVERALRMLDLAEQADEEKLAWLRGAVQEGFDSGIAGPLDMEAVIRAARSERAEDA